MSLDEAVAFLPIERRLTPQAVIEPLVEQVGALEAGELAQRIEADESGAALAKELAKAEAEAQNPSVRCSGP
jgi:hypothetical protein